MRPLLLTLIFALALCTAADAQTKISALPSGTPAANDVVPYVADPAGTPATKKTTVTDFFGVLTPSFVLPGNRHGDGSKFQLFTGASAANDCAKFDSAGNLVTSGAPCGAVTSFNARTGAVTLTSGDVTTALTYTPLSPANNLSDLASASTARTNLGLGTAATAAAPAGAIVGTTDTQTLTNKTISGASNTLSNIGNSSLTNSSVTVGSTSVSLGGTAATVAGLTLTTPTIASFANATHSHQNAAGGGALDAATLGSGTVATARLGSGTASSSTFLRGDQTYADPLALVGARAYHSATQALTSGTPAALVFNSQRFNVGGVHNTVTNNDRLTAPSAGYYSATCQAEIASNATGFRSLSIRLNSGGTIIAAAVQNATNGDSTTLNVTAVYQLAAGDYLRCFAFQNSGGSLNVTASGNYGAEFSLVKVGN